MPTPIKEHKAFFLRNIVVSTGSKPDKETNFPLKYLVKGIQKFNRFLAGNVPSQSVFEKLFESIPFKLDVEDTATTSVQGLVKKASDASAITRTNPILNDFVIAAQIHQLPDIVTSTDGSDTIGTPIQVGDLIVTPVTRNLGNGFSRRNFLIEVNKASVKKYLRAIFTKTNSVLAKVGAGANFLEVNLLASTKYRFEALLFINTDSTGGLKVAIDGTSTFQTNGLIYQMDFSDDGSSGINIKKRSVVFGAAGQLSGSSLTNGVCRISGTIDVNAAGTLAVYFAQNSSNNNSSVQLGSYFIVEELKS